MARASYDTKLPRKGDNIGSTIRASHARRELRYKAASRGDNLGRAAKRPVAKLWQNDGKPFTTFTQKCMRVFLDFWNSHGLEPQKGFMFGKIWLF